MPMPPAPPWPASPPAGAKNVLYVLIDDLRTQMTPFGHAGMKTPHFAAFADTAVLFEQAHCNSQMCVPTRNRYPHCVATLRFEMCQLHRPNSDACGPVSCALAYGQLYDWEAP